MLHQPSRAFAPAPLPRNLRPTLSQADVADYFCEANDDFDEDNYKSTPYFLYCRRQRAWHRAEDSAGDWRYARWSYSEDVDPTPHVYERILKIVRRLTEEASPTERARCLSHAFIAGVERLLRVDPRIACEPWEVSNMTAQRPVRERMRAERDAEHRQAISDMLRKTRSPHR